MTNIASVPCKAVARAATIVVDMARQRWSPFTTSPTTKHGREQSCRTRAPASVGRTRCRQSSPEPGPTAHSNWLGRLGGGETSRRLNRKLAQRWTTTCCLGACAYFFAFVDLQDTVIGTKHRKGRCHGVRTVSDRSDPGSTDARPYVWLRRLSHTHGAEQEGAEQRSARPADILLWVRGLAAHRHWDKTQHGTLPRCPDRLGQEQRRPPEGAEQRSATPAEILLCVRGLAAHRHRYKTQNGTLPRCPDRLGQEEPWANNGFVRCRWTGSGWARFCACCPRHGDCSVPADSRRRWPRVSGQSAGRTESTGRAVGAKNSVSALFPYFAQTPRARVCECQRYSSSLLAACTNYVDMRSMWAEQRSAASAVAGVCCGPRALLRQCLPQRGCRAPTGEEGRVGQARSLAGLEEDRAGQDYDATHSKQRTACWPLNMQLFFLGISLGGLPDGALGPTGSAGSLGWEQSCVRHRSNSHTGSSGAV